MASLEDYLENPQWARNFNYAINNPPNGSGNVYKRWPQGSVGMNSPMNIWSTEFSTLTLKQGTNNPAPYWGSLKQYSPNVTPQLQSQVSDCIKNEWSGARCIGKGLYVVASKEQEQVRSYYERSNYTLPPFGKQD